MVAEKEDYEDESLRINRPVVRTARLLMRGPQAEDVPALAELANNRLIAEMVARMPYPYGETEAAAFVARASQMPQSGAQEMKVRT